MREFLGPLDPDGRVPPRQQTHVAAFLMSAHGAQARQLAVALPWRLRDAGQAELHAQYWREMEIWSLLARATSWVADPMLPFSMWSWEAAWLLRPAVGSMDLSQGYLIDMAAFSHALHAAIRPAALLPEDVAPEDPFASALRRIEFDSGRLIQAQIMFLKSPPLYEARNAVAAAVDRRHAEVRTLWIAMLRAIGIGCR